MSKAEEKVRKLRDDAAELVEKGKVDKALGLYRQLEKLEPNEAGWARKIADCYRRLGNRKEELTALINAADRYSRSGFLVKAIAMCKMALAIDASSVLAQTQLAQLHGAGAPRPQSIPIQISARSEVLHARQHLAEQLAAFRAEERAQREVTPPVAAVEATRTPQQGKVSLLPSLKPGAPLDSVPLNQMVPGSLRPPWAPPGEGGVYELALEEISLLPESLPPQGEGQPSSGQPSPGEPGPSEGARRDLAQHALRKTPLFDEVDPAALGQLIDRIGFVHLEAKQVLFSEGDAADAMYVVAEGEVVAVKGTPEVELEKLTDGDFFGEIGLLSDQTRQATVRASVDTELLVFERQLISELLAEHPGFLKVLLRFLRERLVHTLTMTSPLFSRFGEAEQHALTEQFRLLEVDPETQLIEQGRRSDGLFVLLTGRAAARRTVSGAAQQLGELRSGDIFGEMSLLGPKPAIATVTTHTRCFALFLPAQQFRELVMTNPIVLEYVSALAQERQAELDGGRYSDGNMLLI